MVEKSNLVSVIIPYFNKVNTIERAVDSVINQTHSNWEIWIVDDCSDIKLEVKERWKNLPINLLYNEHNLGPGPSRQKALDLANGNFVAFLDADDWWDSKFIELQVKNLQTEPLFAASWCKSLIYTNNNTIGEIRRYNDVNHNKLIFTLLKYGHSIQTSAFLWRKKDCGYWGNLTTNQDSFFEFSTALNNENIIKLDQVLLFRDETGDEHRSKYVNKDKIYLNNYKLYEYVFDNFSFGFNLKNKIILFNRFLTAYYKVIINTDLSDELVAFKNKYPSYFLLVRNNIFFVKLTLKILNYSPFKFYY